ncbi:MAG: pilus assembly protein [Ilumatobacteraceae bacterium]|nr:pilus assembly protein [Ilumatobacteraceae bacterium]
MTGNPDDRDRGSASLTIVLLAPLLLVLMFAGFQAAMWNHTRTEARVVARETAVLVARDRLSTPRAAAAAAASLANDSVLTEVEVSVDTTASLVVVTITGTAPGVLRGTSAPVRVTAAVSLEGWVPL